VSRISVFSVLLSARARSEPGWGKKIHQTRDEVKEAAD
jgi:hypothetical protein